MDIRDRDFEGGASGREAIEALGHVLTEREKTKRLLIGASCLFFIIAALVIVFAPSEKQNLAYVLGAALMIMAFGAIGASRFKFKLPGISVETNDDQSTRPAVKLHKASQPRINDGSDTMC